MSNILATVIVTFILLLVGILAMGFKTFKKGGRFPNTHIGASKAMKDRGINCATSQDREAQNKKIQ